MLYCTSIVLALQYCKQEKFSILGILYCCELRKVVKNKRNTHRYHLDTNIKVRMFKIYLDETRNSIKI